ncbi:MAG: family 78 glycoside hydrolase catalytic domain [Spirochaetales bacterium]
MEDKEGFEKRAEWIWMRPPRTERAGLIPRGEIDFSDDRNMYVYFRKEFEVSGGIRAASFRASADGRYNLFLNGKMLGRGPARCHPGWQYLDSFEIGEILRPGKNVLSVLVHSYGRDSSFYQLPRGIQAFLFGCAGFYLEGEVKAEGSVYLGLDTDGSWKCLVSEAWERDTPFGGTGYMEKFDARREPEGWKLPGFDDATWDKAFVQRILLPAAGSDLVPFPRLVARDIGALREAKVIPPSPPKPAQDDTLIWDFGRILLGRIGIEVEAEDGTGVAIACGESLGPDGGISRPGNIPGIFTPLSHELRFRAGRGTHTLFEVAGFRYVQTAKLDADSRVKVLSVWAEESSYSGGQSPSSLHAGEKIEGVGSFACSDDLLTRIWRAGAYTAAVCRQDGFIDCPSREQRQWTGDAQIQGLLNHVTCPDSRLARKAIIQAAQTQAADGMVAMASVSDIGAEWRTYIPDYALYWILSIRDYLDYSGDSSFIDEIFPTVAKALGWFMPWLDSAGLLANVPGWVFVDWSEKLDKRGEVLALNALFAEALRAGALVAEGVGAAFFAGRWRKIASTITCAAAERFWDEKRGVYADCRTAAGLSPIVSQQANAAAIAFGVAPRECWDRILDYVLDEGRVTLTKTWRWDEERLFDPGKDVVLAQPFYSHFLHAALARAGRVGDILLNIKKRWEPMLADGGGTFWESWQLTKATSRCHAFSATPVYDLSTYVLGLRPTAPGFARFEVRPWFGNLAWVEGSMPTPAGLLCLNWRRERGRIELEVAVPEGLSGRLLIKDKALSQGGAGGIAQELALEPGINHFSLPAS